MDAAEPTTQAGSHGISGSANNCAWEALRSKLKRQTGANRGAGAPRRHRPPVAGPDTDSADLSRYRLRGPRVGYDAHMGWE